MGVMGALMGGFVAGVAATGGARGMVRLVQEMRRADYPASRLWEGDGASRSADTVKGIDEDQLRTAV